MGEEIGMERLDDLINALIKILNDFGAESFFADSSIVYKCLVEMSNQTDNRIYLLRYTIDIGIGKYYVPFIKEGSYPQDDYYEEVNKFLIDNGLSEKTAVDVINIYNSVLDWKLYSVEKRAETNIVVPSVDESSVTLPVEYELHNKNIEEYTIGFYNIPIKWILLERKLESSLLLCRDVITCRRFDSFLSDWKQSELRKWLNSVFYKQAFSEVEKDKIFKKYGDKVFIPDKQFITKYFKSESELLCVATEEARALGVWEYNGNCAWWIKTPALRADHEMFVSTYGYLYSDGYPVSSNNIGVRPAIIMANNYLDSIKSMN